MWLTPPHLTHYGFATVVCNSLEGFKWHETGSALVPYRNVALLQTMPTLSVY